MQSNEQYWWMSKKNDVYQNLVPYIKYLWDNQPHHESLNLKHLRLYGNYNVLGLGSQDYNRSGSASATNRVTLNIVQSMCDTVQAKIAKQRPKPSFLTEGGNWSLQTRAKKLDKFILGQFLGCDIYQIAPKVFLDACVFGTGVMKIYAEDGQIKAERVFPNEIIVDDTESIYGKPRQIHQVKEIPRDLLKKLFPDKITAIENASLMKEHHMLTEYDARSTDMVTVIESWHLPSTKDSKDGRHTIMLDSGDLVDEPYTRDCFPFVFIKWSDRLMGFFGQGLAEQLTGIQIEINKILRTIQLSMQLTSVPHVFIEKGSGVVSSHINNQIGGIIYYTGKKPSFESTGAVPPELSQHLNFLFNKAYEVSGVSQMSASAMKPAGLNSGVALREYNDIESERFAIVSQNYESMFLDIAHQMILLAKDIYKKDKNYKIKVKGKKFIETIRWDEVDMEEDMYEIQMWPANLLPNTPAGRFERVVEMVQAGFIGKEEALKLMDMPDIEQFSDLANAPLNYVDKQIEIMLEYGEYTPPAPYVDLQLCVTHTQYALIKATNDGAPEDRLELLRRFIEDAQTMLELANPPAPPAPPMPEMGALPPMDPMMDPMAAAPMEPMPEELPLV
jgi:hypothetical protein